MKQTMFNEAALTQSIEFVAGSLGREMITNLYTRMDAVMAHAYTSGFEQGREVGAVDSQYAFRDGWEAGYADGMAVMYNSEQPVIIVPPYEGDKGDESVENVVVVDGVPRHHNGRSLGLPAMQEQKRDDVWR